MSAPFGVSKQSIVMDGLQAPVDILVDCYGVPHIYAETDNDLFFAQGFNAARDRLWQLEMWRRRGLGLMAEVFGPAYVERDRAARLLLYRGDMAAEWSSYGPDAERWTKAFAHGINAYVDLVAKEPERLPVEFVLCGFKPSKWSPEDVVRCRSHARVRNLETEIMRANIAARYGIEQAALVKELAPPWPLDYPDGVTAEAIPDEVLETYRLATSPVDIASATPGRQSEAQTGEDGSNNWAVRPERSTTGRALLATDPHRLQELPSLRYVVHLNAPGLNIIGAGEPAVPGVSLGHNEHIAFGLTIFPTDQEDLLIYELDADNPDRYRYGDDFETIETVTEDVPVRGGEAETVTLHFTRHGPLLHRDGAAGRAYGLRSVWSEPGTAAYLASLRYQRARNWDEFVTALDTWGAPSVNHVYADVDGNVGWITAGKLPVRPNWDGLLPVAGDGRFEWQGFMAPENHPREFNPDRQWVGSANQMNLPDDFDHARHKTGFEFSFGGRYRRITEFLEARDKHSLDDFARLQADAHCLAARDLIARLSGLPAFDGDAARARNMLADWNQELATGSGAAALFEIWLQRGTIPAAMRAECRPEVAGMIEVPDADYFVRRFIKGAAAGTWAETLADAWRQAVALLGSDPANWAWGHLHQISFHHPLGKALGPGIGQRLDIGPLPKAGSSLTVNNNGYNLGSFAIHHGVTWRMLADVGNWDACRMINPPGQSGDPASPHYADHFALWAREEYVPMLFSREAVEAELERHIVLIPA